LKALYERSLIALTLVASSGFAIADKVAYTDCVNGHASHRDINNNLLLTGAVGMNPYAMAAGMLSSEAYNRKVQECYSLLSDAEQKEYMAEVRERIETFKDMRRLK
jgi:hypothetical protein